jgi:hypothetical protein
MGAVLAAIRRRWHTPTYILGDTDRTTGAGISVNHYLSATLANRPSPVGSNMNVTTEPLIDILEKCGPVVAELN